MYDTMSLYFSAAEVSDCGEYLVITPSEGCDPVNRLYYTNLKTLPDSINGLLPYVKVVDNFDAEYEVCLKAYIMYVYIICIVMRC
jgi:hypothetical protein